MNWSLKGQTLTNLIVQNGSYVDKTEIIYKLIQNPNNYYFCRPPGFGLSLLISALKELFLGHRKLFKGLWIDRQSYDWRPYPVIHLDLSGAKALTSPQELEETLVEKISVAANEAQISLKKTYSLRYFKLLIETLARASAYKKIVVLIDGVDTPINPHIADPILARQMAEPIYKLLGLLKIYQRRVHFAFVGGQTKYFLTKSYLAKSFLAPHAFEDVSFNPDYANLLGYSQEELTTYFGDNLTRALKRLKELGYCPNESDLTDLTEILARLYGGYSWDQKTCLFNPLSISKFFKFQAFDQFWPESLDLNFLVGFIKDTPLVNDLIDAYEPPYPQLMVNNEDFNKNNVDHNKLDIADLLLRYGYLTFNPKSKSRPTLTPPNLEVKASLFSKLFYLKIETSLWDVTELAGSIHKAISARNVTSLVDSFSRFMSVVAPQYNFVMDVYSQSLFLLAMFLVDQPVKIILPKDIGFKTASLTTPHGDQFLVSIDCLNKPPLLGSPYTINTALSKITRKNLNRLARRQRKELNPEARSQAKELNPEARIYSMALAIHSPIAVHAGFQVIK
ncbi:MAG: AAA family ATPase [Deltaproteobacteria bacterium]|jgi:hypothetical protein|nr:AAA family ATPase [Deltaproteobacteria bacterium]